MKLSINILLILCLWGFSTPILNAQNGQYDVRFTLQSMSCDSSKITIAVQVRAHDMAHAFNMGDANFRFDYDTRLITTPTLVSQVNFSSQAPSSDYNYGNQNLNGSSAGPTKGVVSLNTFYTGVASGAKRVDTAWITISHIRFNVVGGSNCFSYLWHNEQIFPVTGLNEVELLPNGEYNLYIVASGGVYTNLESCFQTFCNNQGTAPTVQVTPIVTKQDSTVTVCMPITDPDANSTFTTTVCGVAKNGIATPSVNGSQLCVQYVPTRSFTGADSVCITVCDNTSRCTNITIPITVNIRPTAPSVSVTPIVTKQDSTVTVCMSITDPDTGSTFTATLCNEILHGTATPSVNGNQLCVIFIPTANYAGSTEVCVRVCDNTGLCTTVTIPVTVNTRPHAPTVTMVSIVTKEDSTASVCMPITDSDANSSFTAAICGASVHGRTTAVINANQVCLTYIPNAGFSGKDSVCVSVCDNTQLCTTVKIQINVNAKAHAPTIAPVSIRTKQDSTLTVCTTISDIDANSTFTASLCNTPVGGTATVLINGNQLCIRFVPNGTFIGQTSICVNVCDNTNLCAQITVPVTVERRPTAPTVAPLSITTKQDSTKTVCTTISDADDQSTFTATVCNQGAHGTATPSINGNQLCVVYRPNATFNGNDQICIRVCDNTGLCTEVTIPITVNPKPDGRLLVGIHKTLAANQPSTVRLGNSVNYKITVVNKSTFTIMNVLVRDSIPTGMVLNASNLQGWTANEAKTLAVKIIPTIAVGDSVTLDISLVLLYGNPRTHIMNRAFVFNASDQAGAGIITNGEEPKDTASFMVKPFDPMGTIYCENTGFVLKGGHIELVSAPTGGSIFFATDTSGAMLDGTSGEYQFYTNGVPGRYQVRYVHPNGYPLSTRCLPGATALDPTNNDGDITDANSDGVIDKDGIVNGVLTLGSNMVNGNLLQNYSCSNNPYWLIFDLAADDPFVFHNNLPIGCATIKGTTVGIDMNENGLLDQGERPVVGIAVQLFDINNLTTPIQTTTTDGSGKYLFDGLSKGSYRLKFIKPSGYRFAIKNVNNQTDINDSDADTTTGWTRTIALNWGDADTTIGALFVPTNINPPTITGTHIVTKEDSVLNICLPILDNTPVETFTSSVCGVQNGTITNVTINNRQLCFVYTPTFGYLGDDTLCIQVCDRDGQCDTARITLDIQAKNNRLDCRGDNIAPTITFTNTFLNGVQNNDTLSYSCANPVLFSLNDAKATDNSDPRPSLIFNQYVTESGNCLQSGYKTGIENIWTATDSCGNVRVVKVYIKLKDVVPPVFITTPNDTTINLATQTIPTPPSVSATDNCGSATVTMSTDSITTTNSCNYTLIRTWTATDDCGNTSKWTQRITVLKTCPCIPVNAKATISDATCGASNGIATILVDNGINYTYAWSTNNGTGTGNTRANLSAGTYTVTVSRISDPSCQAIITAIVGNNMAGCCPDFISSTSLTTAVNGCTTIADVCITMSNINIQSVTDNGSAYTGGYTPCSNGLNVKLNPGLHNLVFKTITGCYDSISVNVMCANPQPETIETLMVISTKDSITLQTNELVGTRFTLRKINSSTTGSVDYIVIPGTMVVTRTAKSMGNDFATYVVSDEYGITDTTYIKTEVISRTATRRPLAINDKVEITKGSPILIDVMQNDSVLGTLKSLGIITKPKNGSAVLTSDNRITYSPLKDFCGKDELRYALCNGNGCDTGTVSITILCDGIKIFNAFSPNGDGVNDNFVIEGVERYPDNTLNIYNRWGTEVLRAKGYRNDWQGTWHGTILPDGTYFYIFNDGNGKTYKGYVQLQH